MIKRREQPVDREREERQLEHVEADVDVELRVAHAERHAVAEQQPFLPVRRRRQRQDEGEHDRRGVADEAQPVPEHLVEALDVRVHVGRELLPARRGRRSTG